MITDEQRKAFEAWFKENRSSGQMPITKLGSYYLAEHESAWKAWQAAQQVKPLDFEPCNLQSSSLHLAYLSAKPAFGRYLIYKYKNSDGTFHFFTGPNHVSSDNGTEDEAIAAANADYQRRVLSCLVHGSV